MNPVLVRWEGQPGILTFAADVTHRKLAEQTLRESEERLELVLEGADLGLWDWDLSTGRRVINERSARLLGYALDELGTTYDAFIRLLHPEDAVPLLRAYEKHRKDLTPFFEAEVRMLTRSGEWKWILVRGKIVERDEYGTPGRVAGTHLDIDERKRTDELIRRQLREKEVLLREIHHRVKNNMQIISSLVQLQAGYGTNKSTVEVIAELENRIHAMAAVHEHLYRSEDLVKVDVGEYFPRMLHHIMHSFAAPTERVKLETELEDISWVVDTAIPCGLILNELVTNALKYAFPGDREGVIRVSVRRAGDDGYEFTVSDNGIGLPDDAMSEEPATLGLELVRTLVDQLHGRLDVKGSPGTELRIRFKEREKALRPVHTEPTSSHLSTS